MLLGVGAKPITLNIPGETGPNVYSVEDILSGKVKLKDKTVAVVGSGLTGLETAEFLQVDGNKTLIVEMLDQIAPGAYMQNLMDVLSRLAEDKTEYLTSHKLTAIEGNTIVMENTKSGDMVKKDVDAVVLAVGYRSDKELLDSFADTASVVKVIGDAKDVQNIGMAVRSGHATAYEI